MFFSTEKLGQFIRDEDGAVAIEYGLLASLIAVAIVVGAGTVGTELNTLFTAVGTCLSTGTCNF